MRRQTRAERILTARESGNLFTAVDEHVGKRFVAVHVEEGVDARFVHSGANSKHLGTPVPARREPFAIEVRACRVGAQIAAYAAVGIHIRNDADDRLGKNRPRDRIAAIEQALDHAFDEPLRHRLARMLARDHPYRAFARSARADADHVDVAPLDGRSQIAYACERRGVRRAQEIEMAIPGERLEISVVHRVPLGRMVDRHFAAVETRGHARPLPAIVARHGAVVAPAVDVGALARVGKPDTALLPPGALQSEVKPLPKVGVRVRAYVDANVVAALRRDDFDGTGVEGAADLDHVCDGNADRSVASAARRVAAMLPSTRPSADHGIRPARC